MAHGYVEAAGDVVKEGEELDVMILDVDRRKRQIKLSIKALTQNLKNRKLPPGRNVRNDRLAKDTDPANPGKRSSS